ncbi:MAG: phage portal protein [Hyphomicrobiales bacterium]|nr:phage portal protein [Hyphomicrobiales bacterium]
MASFLSRLFGGGPALPQPPEIKASRAARLLALHSMGLARWTPRNYVTLTQQGYERNAVVYRTVRMIAEAAASVPWLMFEGRREITEHPLLDLMARPNPTDVGPTFFEALFTNLLLFGNGYVEATLVEAMPRELYALRPDRMSLVPGASGWPVAYDYMIGGDKVRYPVNAEGMTQILHLKLFHPLDDHYGFSPIAAAQVALDIHNAACGWNKALLDNAARPSGALVYAGPEGSQLSDEQFDRLKAELDDSFSGPGNAGRPLLLEGGLDWKALSMSPRDMDFMAAKNGAARDIALAFGVPPQMLGIPGDNTFSNYQEANRAFWRQTVIPLIARTQKSFAAWFGKAYGPFTFDYNVDRIDALAEERQIEWARVDAASFLTIDEKREALGYGILPRGQVPQSGSSTPAKP